MMINELKRIWRNDKYNILFLTAVEIALIIWFFNLQKGPPSNDSLIATIRTIILIFPASLLTVLYHTKNWIREFDLILPKSRIIIFLKRVTPIFIFTLVLYLLMDFILFPSIKAYSYIQFYLIFLIVSAAIIIYANYFMKYFIIFLVLFSSVVSLALFGSFLLKSEIGINFFVFIMASFNQYFYIILGIFLIPLLLFFLNYRINKKYQFKVMTISFSGIIILLLFSTYFSFFTRSGRIINYSSNNGILHIYKQIHEMHDKTIFYNFEEKCYFKPIILGRKYLFKNKYGSIQIYNYHSKNPEYYIVAKNYKLKPDYINFYITNRSIYSSHHDNNFPEFIYIINKRTLYKIYLKDFKREIIYDDINRVASHFTCLCFEKDGIIYGADERVGIFKALDRKLMAMVQYNEIYYYDIKSKVIMNHEGEIIYKLKDEKVTYNYRYINIKGDNKTRKVVYKDKVYEIPKEAMFTNGKIYYKKDNKIILEDLDGNILLSGDYPDNEILFIYDDERSIYSKKRNECSIHFHNNNYYWILPVFKISKRNPFALVSFEKYTKILLIYKAVDGKFVLYDTIK